MLAEAADWITDQYESLHKWAGDRFNNDPDKADIARIWVTIVCVAAVAVTVIVVAWLVVAVLGALTAGVAQGLITGLGWALERVADWRLTEVVTKPVHDYITAHAAGLPAGAEAIWSAWTLIGPGLWLVCCLTRSWGARLAWVLYGAGTVAVVYSASPASGQLLAAGIAVLYWGVLSVVVFRGIGRRPAVHIHPAPDTAAALEQLRKQVDERLGEVRARMDHMEAANDELAARRGGS